MLKSHRFPPQATGHDCASIGWFPQVRIELSYCHGGKILADLSTFEWHGSTIIQTALKQARAGCENYSINSASSLQLVAFKTEREVVRAQTGEPLHWHRTESNKGSPPPVLISRYPIWSSHQGDISPLDEWERHPLLFEVTLHYQGSLPVGTDGGNLLSIQLREISSSAMLSGLAIADGRIQNIHFAVEPSAESQERGSIRVTGGITVLVDPERCISTSERLLQLASEHLHVEVTPRTFGDALNDCSLRKSSTAWNR